MFLLIFLINPNISFKRFEVINPKLNVFLDNSSSMKNNFNNIDVEIDDILTEIKQARIGVEIWRYILYLAIILLMIEMLISNVKRHN